MIIAIGNDHTGVSLKSQIRGYLAANGIYFLDYGTEDSKPISYIQDANYVSQAILSGRAELGVLCGSDVVGMSNAANNYSGITATITGPFVQADANVLCLGDAGDSEILTEIDFFHEWLQAKTGKKLHKALVKDENNRKNRTRSVVKI